MTKIPDYHTKASLVLLQALGNMKIKYVINKWYSVKTPEGMYASHLCGVDPAKATLLPLEPGHACGLCNEELPKEILVLIQLDGFKGLS